VTVGLTVGDNVPVGVTVGVLVGVGGTGHESLAIPCGPFPHEFTALTRH
jgi:hypothetical protein